MLTTPTPEIIAERMLPGDPYLNYCHWPYEPPAAGIGKLRPEALLFEAVKEMPHGAWLLKTIRGIQRGIGSFRSVYGVKRIDGRWALEVYVYDYLRENRIVSIQRLVNACGGLIQLPMNVDEHIPYFMFSFDLTEHTAAQNGQIEIVHVYIGNPGSSVSSGISYECTQDERQLENIYFFFDAQQQQPEIVDKMRCSVFLDADIPVDELLRPELKSCRTICLANKRTCDTVYFSGIDVDQFLFFLNWQKFPELYIHFVRDHRHELDHLLFDVGVDYRANDRHIEFVKHGFYGVF